MQSLHWASRYPLQMKGFIIPSHVSRQRKSLTAEPRVRQLCISLPMSALSTSSIGRGPKILPQLLLGKVPINRLSHLKTLTIIASPA